MLDLDIEHPTPRPPSPIRKPTQFRYTSGYLQRAPSESMGRPKIFISHRTKTPDKLELLNGLCDELGADFEVLVDRRTLAPGDEWHACIHEWMYECHGAVVLLSDAALAADSSWVPAEAVVVSNRRRNEADFRLIPVLIDTITDQKVKSHPVLGDVARLTDFQCLSGSGGGAEMATQIRDALRDLAPEQSPFEKLVERFREIFGGYQEEVLDRVLAKIDRTFPPDQGKRRCPADLLARTLFRDPGDALANLRKLIEELAHVVEIHHLERMVEMARGLWVNAEAAARLVSARDKGMPAAINCAWLEDFTGHSYARRAWPLLAEIRCIPVGTSRTMADVKKELLSGYGQSRLNPRLSERRLRTLRDKNADLPPIFLLFSALDDDGGVAADLLPDTELLDSIRSEFPKVSVMLATGPNPPDHLPQVVMLHPPLPEGEEERQLGHYERITDYLDSLRDPSS